MDRRIVGRHACNPEPIDERGSQREAEDEGHEPEDTYTAVSCRWIERRERRWCGRYGNLWGDGRQLHRNLSEDSWMLSEVIDGFLCRARLQVLFAIDKERREGSRE